jgi:hypothetical protein
MVLGFLATFHGVFFRRYGIWQFIFVSSLLAAGNAYLLFKTLLQATTGCVVQNIPCVKFVVLVHR